MISNDENMAKTPIIPICNEIKFLGGKVGFTRNNTTSNITSSSKLTRHTNR